MTTRKHLALGFAAATVLFGTAFYTIGAAIKPGYSATAQFISELNATGTAQATALGLLGFVPLGLLFAAFMITAHPLVRVQGASRAGWWLLWSQPVAFFSVAVFPCDLGCPIGGSFSQGMHDLFGVTTYFAGALGLFLLSFAPPLLAHVLARHGLRAIGLLFVALFVAMLVPEFAGIRGLLQRVADALLAIALLTIAWRMLGDERRDSAG